MREGGDHGVVTRQGRRTEFLQNAARVFHWIRIALGRVTRVQQQVGKAETKLPHLRVGRPKRARTLHLLKQLFRYRRARLPVPCEQIESLALPTPVLHDLRGQFHKVPRHVGARQRAHLDAAEQVMQQMAKLVKDGFHFAVGQQGRPAADRRSQISADQAQVRTEAVWRRPACNERVHPGPAPLVVAGIPVGVKPTQQSTIRIEDVVVTHLGIPSGHAGLLGDAYIVDKVGQLEQTGHHPLQRKIRAERFFIERVERRPLLFGVIGDIPGSQFRSSRSFEGTAKLQQFAVFFAEAPLCLRLKVFQEFQRPPAGVSHPVFQHQVREIGEAKQFRLFPTQHQDAADVFSVVPRLGCGTDAMGLVDRLPDRGIVEIGHRGEVIGRLQCKAPAFQVFVHGALSRRGDGDRRQPGQLPLIGDHQFEGVGRVQNILGEFSGELGQLDIDLLESLLSGGIEVGAMTPKILQRFDQEPLPLARQPSRVWSPSVRLQSGPEARVQGDSRIKRARFRLNGIQCRPQIGIGGNRFQVPHDAHRIVQRLGQFVQHFEGIFIAALARAICQGLQPTATVSQQLSDRRSHVCGVDAVEGNTELRANQGIGVVGARHLVLRVTARNPVLGGRSVQFPTKWLTYRQHEC